ncbi:hypothetical protein HBB16_15160 [Pseudonocardia sp. MCCB 268]|nr:hypothetical protein [Pseudonocardia cytotoxica]
MHAWPSRRRPPCTAFGRRRPTGHSHPGRLSRSATGQPTLAGRRAARGRAASRCSTGSGADCGSPRPAGRRCREPRPRSPSWPPPPPSSQGTPTSATGRVAFGFLGTLGPGGGATDPARVPARTAVRTELVQSRHCDLSRVRRGRGLALTSLMPDEPGLAATARWPRGELRLVVPAGHRLATRSGRWTRRGRRRALPAFARGYGLHGTVVRRGAQAGLRPHRAFEGGETATLRGLAGAGLGRAVPARPDALGVVQLPVRSPRTVRTLAWCTPRRPPGHRRSVTRGRSSPSTAHGCRHTGYRRRRGTHDRRRGRGGSGPDRVARVVCWCPR